MAGHKTLIFFLGIGLVAANALTSGELTNLWEPIKNAHSVKGGAGGSGSTDPTNTGLSGNVKTGAGIGGAIGGFFGGTPGQVAGQVAGGAVGAGVGVVQIPGQAIAGIGDVLNNPNKYGGTGNTPGQAGPGKPTSTPIP